MAERLSPATTASPLGAGVDVGVVKSVSKRMTQDLSPFDANVMEGDASAVQTDNSGGDLPKRVSEKVRKPASTSAALNLALRKRLLQKLAQAEAFQSSQIGEAWENADQASCAISDELAALERRILDAPAHSVEELLEQLDILQGDAPNRNVQRLISSARQFLSSGIRLQDDGLPPARGSSSYSDRGFWITKDRFPDADRQALEGEAIYCDMDARFQHGKKIVVFNYRHEGDLIFGTLMTKHPYRGPNRARQFDVATVSGEVLTGVSSCLCCRATKVICDPPE